MKTTILGASAAFLSVATAHSWLECTDYDTSEILPWMQGNSTLDPPVIIDPGMPWYEGFCKGYPRSLQAGGNWIEESSDYIWNIAAERFNMGAAKPADTNACPPEQRSPTYLDGAPMKTAAAGDSIKLFFGGNGHTRGYNTGGTANPNPAGPGTVSVYWKGAPEQEITDISEFTQENLLQSNGFADESFSYPADPSIKTPEDGLVDKGNWQTIKLPSDMAAGRHMMVWVWTYAGSTAPQWSTCFDVMIQGSSDGDSSSAAPAPTASSPAAVPSPAATNVNTSPVAASPNAPVNAVASPAPPATTPAPAPPKDESDVVIETVWTTVDVWTTIWDNEKRSHVRQFKPLA